MPVWRHIRAIALLPGVVTVLVPAIILFRAGTDSLGLSGSMPALRVALGLAGACFLVVGLTLMIATNRLFAKVGRGTLAPWDAPRQFVAVGIYRHVRNPMMCGVFAVLFGEALVAASPPLLEWNAIVVALNLIYIPLVEEPGLARRFGRSYEVYRQNVPRWIPRLKPWQPPAGSDTRAETGH